MNLEYDEEKLKITESKIVASQEVDMRNSMSARELIYHNIDTHLKEKNLCNKCFRVKHVETKLLMGEGPIQDNCDCVLGVIRNVKTRYSYCIIDGTKCERLKILWDISESKNLENRKKLQNYESFLSKIVYKKYQGKTSFIWTPRFTENMKICLFTGVDNGWADQPDGKQYRYFMIISSV